jgi:hypothetical protein
MLFFSKAAITVFMVSISIVLFNSNNAVCLLLHPPTAYGAQQLLNNNNNNNNKLFVTHGIASGDITNNSAIIWSRSNSESIMNVQYSNTSDFPLIPIHK